MSSPHPGEQQGPAQGPPAPTQPLPQTGDSAGGAAPAGGSPYIPFEHYEQQHAAAPFAQQPTAVDAPPTQPPTPAATRRRGPGWLGAGAMTLTAALLAGGIGGVGGAALSDDGGDDGPTIVQRDGGSADRPDGSVAAIAADAALLGVAPAAPVMKVVRRSLGRRTASPASARRWSSGMRSLQRPQHLARASTWSAVSRAVLPSRRATSSRRGASQASRVIAVASAAS